MQGLECMANSDIECDVCPYRDDSYLFCSTGIVKDAIACIRQLERDKNWASENYDLISEENKRLEAQVPKWINVEGRLPEIGEIVLAYVDELRLIIRAKIVDAKDYRGERRIDWARVDPDPFFLSCYTITHWMPLPEPPKEDT